MGATGKTTVDFGPFPGSLDVAKDITGQTGILAASSLAEAWLIPEATADHSADEHLVDGPAVTAGNIVTGTGFTIYARVAKEPTPPRGDPHRVYGLWTVGWVWS
jgi:hypothetical protein